MQKKDIIITVGGAAYANEPVIVHGIASFLLAHLDFETPGLSERAVELAKNTLAHFF